MEILISILALITAHIFGDYVFQTRYIAESKTNIYHLLVHCWIYTTCFGGALWLLNKLNFGIILFIFLSHIIIDYLKANIGNKIGSKAYVLDQILHYIVIVVVFFLIK